MWRILKQVLLNYTELKSAQLINLGFWKAGKHSYQLPELLSILGQHIYRIFLENEYLFIQVAHNLRSRPVFDVGNFGSYLQFTPSAASSSIDRSPARSKSPGRSRSPARGSRSPARSRQSVRSRSPARSKPAEEVENSGLETKPLPKTPQKSPVRQSQRILERRLDKSPCLVLSDILVRMRIF